MRICLVYRRSFFSVSTLIVSQGFEWSSSKRNLKSKKCERTKQQLPEFIRVQVQLMQVNFFDDFSCFFFSSSIEFLASHMSYYKYCPWMHDHEPQMTAFIHESYMRFKPLLYPCTIEFSLMCLTVCFLSII